jgi:hypothetical protein
MDTIILLVSVTASIFGVLLDNLSTKKMTIIMGKDAESNEFFRCIVEKYGYVGWSIIEALFCVFFVGLDLAFKIIFLGILYGSYRSLAGIRNFRITFDYQRIGLDAYKKDYEKRKGYLMCVFVCIIASVLIFVTFYTSGLNLFIILPIEGLILGIGFAIFRMYRLAHV